MLTDENLTELVERAAYRTKAEVEELVVSVKPRPVPVEGVRRLSFPAAAANGAECPALSPTSTSTSTSTPTATPTATSTATEVRPVAEERWSVRVTLDAAAKADLDELKALLSHKVPDGDVGAVVREALRFALEKLRVRRGAAAPARARRGAGTGSSANPRQIPAAIRREVWKRDGGRCTFVSADGRRCESRARGAVRRRACTIAGGSSRSGKFVNRDGGRGTRYRSSDVTVLGGRLPLGLAAEAASPRRYGSSYSYVFPA